MKKFLALVCVLFGAAVYAHYRHWLDLPAAWLPRETLAEGATPWRVPLVADWLAKKNEPQARGRRRPAFAIPVVAAVAKKQDVPETAVSVATARALNTVVVRPEVEGRLIEIHFKEGEEVKQGQVLARIDPATFQAQYDQAVAKKAQDQAELANARIDLERYIRLARTNFGSRQQADTQRAKVAQLAAQIKVDQAVIDNAKAILDRTTIRAPIAGRTGLRNVDVGNIVRSSDAGGLVTITQLRPISVLFNLPQQRLRAINSAAARGPVKVEALESDGKTIVETGVVEVVDNQVDTTTGTVRIKARFENPGMRLWPGQFVNIRVYLNVIEDAIVVPAAAVQRGPEGAYVYVIDKDDKAQLRNIKADRQDDVLAVVTSGLAAGERVVTTGFARLSGGEKVRPQMQDERSAGPDRSAPPGRPPGRG
ncbi:MAG: efflux RND transporter periplasmic adaptor subunit [Beijerinckiaceae bacterium]